MFLLAYLNFTFSFFCRLVNLRPVPFFPKLFDTKIQWISNYYVLTYIETCEYIVGPASNENLHRYWKVFGKDRFVLLVHGKIMFQLKYRI